MGWYCILRRTVVLVISLLNLSCFSSVDASGLLLLYRPRDITNPCVLSHYLRYDISFGHGMSDTITLVFRTLREIDYECLVEIVIDDPNAFLIIVIRFPNLIITNCKNNGDAFIVFKKNRCVRVCDVIQEDHQSPYLVLTVKERLKFRFLGNSSINNDMNANYYQVTGTSARMRPRKGCDPKNETVCITPEDTFCFTGGVVCDGIKNCGVTDWYDERKSDCDEAVKRIGYAPVVAVLAVIVCMLLACGHLMKRWLPPLANSFFIFNANEDNRLCIDPVFVAPDYAPCEDETAKRISIIPVSTSSSESAPDENSEIGELVQKIEKTEANFNESTTRTFDMTTSQRRKNTIRAVTEMFQQRLRSVAGRGRVSKSTNKESRQPEVL